MPSSARNAALGRAAYLLFAVLVQGGFSARPGGADVLLESRIGFGGLFRLGQPFPVQIDLTNTGPEVQGNLDVRVWRGGAPRGGNPYPFHYRQQVFLAPQARKSVRLTVDPDFVSRPLTITFSSARVRAGREIDLRRHFSPTPLALLLSEGSRIPWIPPTALGAGRLVSVSISEVPAEARALLGVSTLIVYDQSLQDLSPEQIHALETWIAAGGRLLILASVHAALYQGPAMNRFLPVKVSGLKKLSGAAALKLPGAADLKELWIQEARPVAGRTILELEGSPIVVEADRGKGKIVYLALDIGRPPLAGWNGLTELFKGALAPLPERVAGSRSVWDESVFLRLFLNPTLISTYIPSGALFAALLGYTGVVFSAPWIWQRRKLSFGRALAGLFLFSAASSVGGYLFFGRGGNIPDGVMVSATLLDEIAEGYAEAQSNVGIFSTQPRDFDLRVDPGWLDLLPVSARSRPHDEPSLVSYPGTRFHRVVFPLREWDYRLLRFRFVERFPVYVGVERAGDRIKLRLDHRGSRTLTDCWLILPGQRHFLGEIAPGTAWTRELAFSRESPAGAEESPRPAENQLRDLPFKDPLRELLFHNSFFPREVAATLGGQAALFFGWVKEPPRRLWAENGRIRAYEQALFRKVVSLGGEDE
ncbi:MAG TPA: hypothetical protein VNN77_07525 [candidate division Zixibacteria bacterium]|nr:hypothetical protein [candidate division Zixibacteria bacterium]